MRAILDTMQNWVDNTQTRVPGYRDRIVHISHNDMEGGLNLAMPPKTLTKLTERGRQAGRLLLDAYTHGPESERSADPCRPGQTLPPRVVSWENHRWVRLRTTLSLLSDAVTDFGEQLTDQYAEDLAAAIAQAPSYPFTNQSQQALGRDVAAGLRRLAAEIEAAESTGPNVPLEVDAPSPAPVLRIAPGGVRPAERAQVPDGGRNGSP